MDTLCPSHIQKLTPYQPGKPIKEFQRQSGLERCIKLASNENPLGPSPRVKALLQGYDFELALYPESAGFELKKAIQTKTGVSPDGITLGNGSDEIIRFLIQAFVHQDEHILCPEYSFSAYEIFARSLGVGVEKAQTLGFATDINALVDKVSDKTKIVFIANPNNPTGTYSTQAELDHLLNHIPSEVLCVVDEAYFEYMDQEDYPDTPAMLTQYPNLVVLRTFSKVYGLAGLRLGYSLSSKTISDVLNRVRAPFNINSVALVCGLAAMQDETHVNDSIRANREGLLQLKTFCHEHGLNVISQVGNFITIQFADANQAKAVHGALEGQGILTRPLVPYGMGECLRVSVGSDEQNKVWCEAMLSFKESIWS